MITKDAITTITMQTLPGPSRITFLIEAMHLVQILRDTKRELYGWRQRSQSNHQSVYESGDYSVLKSLESRLLTWHAALPKELIYPARSPMTVASKHIRLQAICLFLRYVWINSSLQKRCTALTERYRYQYALMLIYRPALSCLLEEYNNKCNEAQSSGECADPTREAWSDILLQEHARNCVRAAVDFIHEISKLVFSRDSFSIFGGYSWALTCTFSNLCQALPGYFLY